ncbi:MAG: hypothetical protein ACETWK_07960 [Candidatus Aminicenantaceae bacterium]
MLYMPRALAKRPIFRVDNHLIKASCISPIKACSDRFISVIKKRTYPFPELQDEKINIT